MAELLWGHVYYQEVYAGMLRQEPGERCSFTYDPSYVAGGGPAVAWTLPLRAEPQVSSRGLHPFFDNLVAEGWLEEAQTRLLGKRQASRFELLLAFGADCAGAVSVRDPDPAALDRTRLDLSDPRQAAVLVGRASLSGVQPKLALVEKKGKFHPARSGELSTYIAKFPSQGHADLVMNEYLTTQAFNALLPGDRAVDLQIAGVEGFQDPALIIKRFDRTADGQRLHFEEFNQLLGRPSSDKYDGAHKDMADFLRQTPGCLPAEIYRLYVRIVAGLLLGNTDMHFKNFALFHTPEGFRLTPSYDQVAAALYGYKTVALTMAGVRDMPWATMKAKAVIRLGEEFALPAEAIRMAFEQLATRQDTVAEAINDAAFGTPRLKKDLMEMVKKRWNGTFSLMGSLIGPRLSK